jgi:hypothetical protein
MSVSCECCVLSGRGICDELVPRPEESYRVWCVSSVIVKPQTMRRPRLPRGCRGIEKTIIVSFREFLTCPTSRRLFPLTRLAAVNSNTVSQFIYPYLSERRGSQYTYGIKYENKTHNEIDIYSKPSNHNN